MNTEFVSYKDFVKVVRKQKIKNLLFTFAFYLLFMVIILSVREMKPDAFVCAFAAVLALVPLFGGVIPLLQMNSKLKKMQQKLNAETDADMDELLSGSTRIHPFCFLTDAYLISFQNMFVCDLQEIRCIQMTDSSQESTEYTIRVQCGGISGDYLNYQRQSECDEAFRALMNAVPPECKVKNGLSTIR